MNGESMQRERARGLFVKYTECKGAFVKLKAQDKIQRGMPNVASTVVLYEFVTADKLEG